MRMSQASTIDRSGIRGLYVYHNATLIMHDSTVSNTLDLPRPSYMPDGTVGAVQVEALVSGHESRVVMRRCHVVSNRGSDFCIRGSVVKRGAMLEGVGNFDSHPG